MRACVERRSAPKAAGRVRKPRHLILFRLEEPALVLVVALLHESMDREARVRALFDVP